MKIKWLATNTSQNWLDLAMANPYEVLIDHAHCEKKAAGVALQMMFRYPSEKGLSEVLSPLVREELEHFERVIALLNKRGQSLKMMQPPPYGALLGKSIRKIEPERMLDSFLVAGIIEARSHERMGLIASNSQDIELRTLYGDLLASEARHFSIYIRLATERYEQNLVFLRLNELSQIEAGILSNLHPEPRMHS